MPPHYCTEATDPNCFPAESMRPAATEWSAQQGIRRRPRPRPRTCPTLRRRLPRRRHLCRLPRRRRRRPVPAAGDGVDLGGRHEHQLRRHARRRQPGVRRAVGRREPAANPEQRGGLQSARDEANSRLPDHTDPVAMDCSTYETKVSTCSRRMYSPAANRLWCYSVQSTSAAAFPTSTAPRSDARTRTRRTVPVSVHGGPAALPAAALAAAVAAAVAARQDAPPPPTPPPPTTGWFWSLRGTGQATSEDCTLACARNGSCATRTSIASLRC